MMRMKCRIKTGNLRYQGQCAHHDAYGGKVKRLVQRRKGDKLFEFVKNIGRDERGLIKFLTPVDKTMHDNLYIPTGI